MQLAKPYQFANLYHVLHRDPGNCLPLHLMGFVPLAQAERGGKVAREHVHLLDVGQESLVDSLLVRRTAAGDLLLL